MTLITPTITLITHSNNPARSAGYCGADLKALCTEASLGAVRRTFPQLYDLKAVTELKGSGGKGGDSDPSVPLRFAVDAEAIRIGREDFERALENIVPASQRSVPKRIYIYIHSLSLYLSLSLSLYVQCVELCCAVLCVSFQKPSCG